MYVIWTVCFITIALSACRNDSWNPDTQFAEQRQIQDEAIQKAQFEKSQNISKNVLRIERDALVRIQTGIPISELNKVMGYRFEVLASIPETESVWETRRYSVGQLIASRFGQNSKEYEFCDQNRKLFTLTLANGLVRTIDY
jgi:hypothetical protein